MLTQLPGLRAGRDKSAAPLLALIAILGFLYGPVRHAYADVAIGATSGSFLDFEVGGRPGGMAGAQVASASGVTAQYWNPAGLADLNQSQVGAMHANWMNDLSYEWLGYARPMSPSLGVGSLSVAYFHLPSIAGVDQFRNSTGDFSVYDMAITAGLARELGSGVSVGANARLIRQSLATVSATGASFDFGATAKLPMMITFGAVAQNFGPSLSYGSGSSYPLPHQLRFGVSREFMRGRVLLATDVNMPSDYYNDVRVGSEFRVHPNVAVRMGYRHEFGVADDPANGLSYGLGLNFRQFNFDYSMTPSPDLDPVHRLSFGYSFGSTSREHEPKQPKPEEQKPAKPTPKGPTVIAQAKPAPAPKKAPAQQAQKVVVPAPIVAAASKEPAATPSSAPAATPAPQTASSAASSSPAVASAPAPAPTPPASTQPAPQPAPKAGPTEYAVVLPSYESKESAQAEVKALELLGFRTKDVQIQADLKRGGYQISFARMKDRQSAEQTVADLQRMSFRAIVEVVQR